MKGARIKSVGADALAGEARALRQSGGRMQFAYAWSPNGDDTEIRYAAALPGQREFEIWVLESAGAAPSLAQTWPLLGWYEREMMDLTGTRFIDHPEPYPLVLFDGASPPANGHNYLGRTSAKSKRHLPTIDAEDVQRLPFGPIRADVVESAEFMFFYVGEHIIHYEPRLFFKHRGMETRFEGCSPNHAVVVAERVSGVGTIAHALAYCEALERAAGCETPVRARALRVLLADSNAFTTTSTTSAISATPRP